MKFITDVLDDLQIASVKCCICKDHLTLTPVLINVKNGKSICGRCTSSSTSFNLFNHNHLFELLANQFVFPCKNTSEGCTVRLPFRDIHKHEKSCTYRILMCHCLWRGNPIEFKTHYENIHKDLIIKDGDTVEMANDCSRFLFVNKNFHFFINCKYNVDGFRLGIVGLSSIINECKAVFICKPSDSNSDFRIAVNTFVNIPFKSKPVRFTLRSEIPAYSIDNVAKCVVCPNCSYYMVPPILRCSKGHLTCIECTDSWLEFCQACEDDSDFTCDPELECVAAASIFLCKWNCGNRFSAPVIQEHEQSCEKRNFGCWIPWHCKWNGSLTQLKTHSETCASDHSDANHSLLIFDAAYVTFLGSADIEYVEQYLLTYNCRFNIRYDYQDGTTSVSIICCDIYGFGRFCYAADIRHMDDSNACFDKTFKLKHTYGGCYSLDFPEDVILRFGKDRCFKITVHIILLNETERIAKTDLIYKKFKNYRRLLF